MLLCVMGVEFEKACTVSRKWSEDTGSVQDCIFCFCLWCKSGKLGGRMSPRFPCVTPIRESFISNLLRAIISYWTESHLESYQTFTMELFCKKNQRPKDVDNFRKKTPSQMLEWIPNAPPIGKVLVNCECMEFVAAGCCAGKQLRLNRTFGETGMFHNYCITFYFLTKSNSATEVVTTVFVTK